MSKNQNKLDLSSPINSSSSKEESVDMSHLVLSLIDESAYLADVLNCSLRLMELFDADKIVDCVVNDFRKSCQADIRIWRLGEMLPVLMGTASLPLPQSSQEQDSILDAVIQASEQETGTFNFNGCDFHRDGQYVMEIVTIPKDRPYTTYISTLYFRHLVRSLNNLSDRLVIAKAFNEIREILDLKERLEGSLHDIRDQSNNSISAISEYIEEIIETSQELQNNKKRAQRIEELAHMAINETQLGDLTNQKIFASLHNLETLFSRLTNSLDTTSKEYLESLYQPKPQTPSEGVVSNSLLQGQVEVDQSAVDSLLADLGL